MTYSPEWKFLLVQPIWKEVLWPGSRVLSKQRHPPPFLMPQVAMELPTNPIHNGYHHQAMIGHLSMSPTGSKVNGHHHNDSPGMVSLLLNLLYCIICQKNGIMLWATKNKQKQKQKTNKPVLRVQPTATHTGIFSYILWFYILGVFFFLF